MMKTLRYFFVAALAMVMTNAMAQTEFDFDNAATMFGLPGESSGSGASYVSSGDFTEAKTATIGDFSVTVSPAAEGVKTPNRIWSKTPKLRLYSGTLTIKSTGAAIKRIDFTGIGEKTVNNNKVDAWDVTASTGSLSEENKVAVWTGEAQEIVFTVASNTQMAKLVINGEGGDTPEPPVPSVEEITVAKALELCNALAEGATSTEEYIITGFIVGDPTWKPYEKDGVIKNYNLNVNIADAAGSSTTMLVYNIFNLENTYFPTIDEDIKDGVNVKLQGKLQKYVKNSAVTPEIVKAHFLAIGSKTGIESVKANAKFDGKMYNVAGQVVNKGYKGLVIMNGKKMIMK